jgi:hypothetical protein
MDLKPDMNYIMFDKIHNIIGGIISYIMGLEIWDEERRREKRINIIGGIPP